MSKNRSYSRLSRKFRTVSLSACAALSAMALPNAGAQRLPTEVAGPYNAIFLADGPGLTYPAPARWGSKAQPSPIPNELMDPHAHLTLVFWFQSSEASTAGGTALLAGIGDPAADDNRFIGVTNGKLTLELGRGHLITADSTLGSGEWHLAALVAEDGDFKLYADGRAVAKAPVDTHEVANRIVLAPSVPEGIADHHFGGKIADLKIYAQALTPEQMAALAATPPNFDLPQYTEASAHWPVQTRAMAGQLEPQTPSTLPRGKGGVQKPVAKPVDPSALQAHLVGTNPWKIAGGWKLAAAPDVMAQGDEIARVGFATDRWLAATVPGTVLTTLIDRGVYPDPDYGLNNLAIPESLAHQDYWYRVEFEAPPFKPGQHLNLTFNGVNYASEVWVNGNRLGDFTGAFLRGNFDISAAVVHAGVNAVAVRVSPPPHPGLAEEESLKAGPGENGGMQVLDGPTFSATEGWDWIPSIRDRNTGIWQDVTLTVMGPVMVGDLNVITTLPQPDRGEADIEIEAPLMNTTNAAVEGNLVASFDDVKVTKRVTLKPGETAVLLKPEDFGQLKVKHPRLWWPNGYGDPALHALNVQFVVAGQVSSAQNINFGMREVSYELSLFDKAGHLMRVEVLPSRTHDQHLPLIDESHQGIRQIDDRTPNLDHPQMPDGSPVPPGFLEGMRHTWVQTLEPGAMSSPSIRSVDGGWPGTDLVIKVNGIRIAARGGNWGMDDSRKRVSLEHLEPYFRLHRDAHVNMIRNWMGQNTEENFYELADKYGLMVWNDFWESTQNYNLEAQDPELLLENARDTILHFRHHPSIILWCGRNEGVPQPILNEGLAHLVRTLDHTRYYTGSSNQVNLRNSGPYQLQTLDTYYRINRGFSVELGIPSVPTLEGLKAFIPEPDRWPISDTWAYHDWHVQGNGAVKPFMDTMDRAFGAPTSLEDFERKAQMIDYAAHRAIFEGFAAHLWEPNSARLIWMTQPAWPSMEWNFLGHDYDTQSSFYGTQKACEPVHAQLNLEDGSVDLINLHEAQKFNVRIRALSVDGKSLQDQTLPVQAAANARTAVSKLDLAKLADGHTIFVDLKVSEGNGTGVSENFYWWSEQDSTLQELNSLPQASIDASATLGGSGSEQTASVTLRNTAEVPAVLVKLTLVDSMTGERILPAYYSENYVSLLPGEQKSVTIQFPADSVHPAVALRGWNLEPTMAQTH